LIFDETIASLVELLGLLATAQISAEKAQPFYQAMIDFLDRNGMTIELSGGDGS
jgi:hypothetical protein